MTGETLLILVLAVVLAALALGAGAVLRPPPPSRAALLLGRGEFTAALKEARTGAGAARQELYVAAVAAKHLLRLDRAAALLDRLLALDPSDGEAQLERGLVAAYAGRLEEAAEQFRTVARSRADLTESLTLHRAWLALEKGELSRARDLFEEVAVPLETKLRQDIGPGDPLFAEWFLQAAALWQATGEERRAAWAAGEGLAAAPESRLGERIGPFKPSRAPPSVG